jgi:hypothetical protein
MLNTSLKTTGKVEKCGRFTTCFYIIVPNDGAVVGIEIILEMSYSMEHG